MQVAERERHLTPPHGGRTFVPRAKVMDADDVRRSTWRMAHEIIEFDWGIADMVLIGLQTGGVHLAHRLAEAIEIIEGVELPVGTLDVAYFRDDVGLRPVLAEAPTDIPCDLTGKTVVLVDDVLYTGRTVRAALNVLADHGRARAVRLAVMVERGHRELPIRPDFVGKNLPTRRDEMVDVSEEGVVLGDLMPRR